MKKTIEAQANPVEDESFWLNHYESQKLSGHSRADYCRHHKLNYDRFGYWIHKWKHQNTLIPVKLKLADEVMPQQILCTLNLKNGHCLKIYDAKALGIILERYN
jgi:hypothetical protein